MVGLRVAGGGTHEREHDGTSVRHTVVADDLRGVQVDGGFGGGALYLAAVSPAVEPPAAVIGEPVVQAPAGAQPEPSPVPPAPQPAVQPSTEIERLVCSYQWSCAVALRILYCESGGRPHAIGGGANFGLFQINRIHAARWPGFWERWMIPEYNVEYAWSIYQGRGWSAWSCW